MKKFTLTISVDEDKLKQSYLSQDTQLEENDFPSTSELVSQEFGWLEASGILISEVHESKPQLNEFHIFQTLSGNFLCELVPDDWRSMTEEQQNQFIEDHKWQPLEYLDVIEIHDLIKSATKDMINLLQT